MPLVLADLREIAAKCLARENPGHTLQPTALVNEVYLRLVGRRTVSWRNRAQFFGFLAGMMRRILVDHARNRQTAKRGSGGLRISLDETIRLPEAEDPDMVALDEAMKSLAEVDPRQSRIVELRYFAGLTIEEIAEVEGISPTTVKREWRTAKLWLFRALSRG
jgi:RNA polymerase sigma factor (TIGR02999 family)